MKFIALLLTVFAFSTPAYAAKIAVPKEGVIAIIDLSDQQMTLRLNKTTKFTWPVSTGRRGHETPTGKFRPFLLSEHHKSSLYDDAPMPHSVFFNGNIAVHGTNHTSALGRRASHGCVRLHPENAKRFFGIVKKLGKHRVTVVVRN